MFPKVERLLSYTLAPGQVDLADAEPQAVPTVLFGIRPCEAARLPGPGRGVQLGLPGTGSSTPAWSSLAVIGMGCTRRDDACFCTSVGGGPGSTKGSDILLTPTAGGYLAEVLTRQGRGHQGPGA